MSLKSGRVVPVLPGESVSDAAGAPHAAPTLEPTEPMARRRRYWQLNRWLVAGLVLAWALVTFGVSYHARALSFRFFGWPFSFWMAAQGALLVYLLLVIAYDRVMDTLDHRYQLDEED